MLGSSCVVESGAVVQAHVLEHNGLLTTGRVCIGARATVGPGALTLPGFVLGDGAQLQPNALGPKGFVQHATAADETTMLGTRQRNIVDAWCLRQPDCGTAPHGTSKVSAV